MHYAYTPLQCWLILNQASATDHLKQLCEQQHAYNGQLDEEGRAMQGEAGQGRVGQGRAGQGRAGQGRAGQDQRYRATQQGK